MWSLVMSQMDYFRKFFTLGLPIESVRGYCCLYSPSCREGCSQRSGFRFTQFLETELPESSSSRELLSIS